MQPRSKGTRQQKKNLNKLHKQLSHVLDRVKRKNHKQQVQQARAEARRGRARARRALLRDLRRDGVLSSEQKSKQTKKRCLPNEEPIDADDFFVVIVGDEEKRKRKQEFVKVSIKQDPDNTSDMGVINLIETVKMHGDVLPIEFNLDIKVEPVDEADAKNKSCIDENVSEDNNNLSEDIKDIPEDDNNVSEDDDVSEYNVSEDNDVSEDDSLGKVGKAKKTKKPRRRFRIFKPGMENSYIDTLRQQHPELREDKNLLIDTLCEIMRSVRPPTPPQDYFIMNDIMFECTFCGVQSRTVPAAARHYQHKHGSRYLVCFACGVDFVSTTDLYRHEKRCLAPDAVILLKARALFLGPKGRSRPYLKKYAFKMTRPNVKRPRRRYIKTSQGDKYKYKCDQCSAMFTGSVSLQSHMHQHNGIRPYQCSYCPAAYTSKVSFRNHTKRHLNVEYICDHCNRSFKLKKHLVVHMNTHMPQKQYVCEFCGKHYAQKTSMTAHVNKVHLKLPPEFACHLCDKRYRKNFTLKEHLRRDHGSSLITRDTFFRKLPNLSEAELNEAKMIFNPDLTFINDTILTPETKDAENHAEEEVKPKLKKKRERKQRKKVKDNKKIKKVKDDKLINQNGDLVSRREIAIQERLMKEKDDKIINQNGDLVSRREIEEQEKCMEEEDDKIINQDGDLVSRREIAMQDEISYDMSEDYIYLIEEEEEEDDKIIDQNGDLVSRREIERQEKVMEEEDDKIINQNGDLVSHREIEKQELNDWKVSPEVKKPRRDDNPGSILKTLRKEIVVKKISANKGPVSRKIRNKNTERDTVRYFAIEPMDNGSILKVNSGLKRKKAATDKPQKIFLSNQQLLENKLK